MTRTGVGFLPLLLAAAIPAVTSLIGSKQQSSADAAAADAAEAQAQAAIKQARLAAKAAKAESEQRAKTMKTVIWVGGGVAVLGLAAWMLMRRRRRK
jgi:cellobiose-specific phosphotransferase system component IIC